MGEEVKPCDEPCAKCGSLDVYRRFFGKGAEMKAGVYDKRPNKYATGQCNSWASIRDHLHNHCRCCGYEWQRLPMKKTKSIPPPPVTEAG